MLKVLGEENNRTGGAVEAYIYRKLTEKERILTELLKPWLSGSGGPDAGKSLSALLKGLSVPGMEAEERMARESAVRALLKTFGKVLGAGLSAEGEKQTDILSAAAGLLTGREQGDGGFFTAECLEQWFERMMDGPCKRKMGGVAAEFLAGELSASFSGRNRPWKALADRGYETIRDGFWR